MVQFTAKETKETIYVNPRHIVCFMTLRGTTVLTLSTKVHIEITESPEEVAVILHGVRL